MICYHARWVVPVTTPPVEDGTVACDGGIIQYVGPRRGSPAGVSYDLGDALLLPGLVNAHTHLELTAMRGFLEGLSFTAWIDTLRRARTAVLGDETLLDSARLGVVEGVERGITTYADTGASDAPFRAMRELGVRGIAYQELFGPDPDVCDAALADLDRRIAQLRADPGESSLVTLGVSPHAPYTVSDALYHATAQYARREGLPMAMHVAESADEGALVTAGTGIFAEWHRRRGIPISSRARSPVALLDQTQCLHDRALLIHAVRLDPDDIRTITLRGATVAHCPASNAKFGHGIAPLSALLDAGVPVGLGSDSVASNNRMDILDEARLATLLQSVRTGSHATIPPQTALELATIRGACALHLEDRIGSLDPGKAADLSAFPLHTARTIPACDPVATAIYAMSGVPARFVSVAGKHLIEDSQPVEMLARAVVEAPHSLHDRVTQIGRALAAWRDPT